VNRELFIESAKKQPDISPVELAQSVKDNSVMFRFLGKLFREQLDFENSLVQMDLVTEEGRMKALRQQGIVQGRGQIIESLVDMFLEGVEDGRDAEPEPEFELAPRRLSDAAE